MTAETIIEVATPTAVARKPRKPSIKPKKKTLKQRTKARQANVLKARDTRLKKIKEKREAATRVEDALAANPKRNIADADDFITADNYVEKTVIFKPNPGPQTEFLAATEDEIFFGGARGGSKTYSLIVDPLRFCNNGNFRGLLIRRTMPELRDIINHTQRLYPKAYIGAKWREQEKEWRFPSGARIEFGYCETDNDVFRYQGQAYTWIGIDELPQFATPDIYTYLKGSLRTTDPTLKTYMRSTGNPGGAGAAWVKEMFIDPAKPNEPFKVSVKLPDGREGSIIRRFIPAKLSDNPHLLHDDSYLTMLASLPDIKKKQWLDGDWDAFEGAAFPEFHKSIHTIEPMEIPTSWIRFRAADWGYSSPACVLWFAVDYNENLYVYREFYVKHMTADIFAQKVLEREYGESIRYGVLDASTWAQRGQPGPSIAEMMIKNGCRWRPSDRTPRSREHGKLEIHRRLKINEMTNEPSVFIFNTCTNLIKQLASLPIDDNNPEDVNTTVEDHAYDAFRYGVMSRPISPAHLADSFNLTKQRLTVQPRVLDMTFGY